MKNSTGVVMQLDKRYALVMTGNGQFLKLKVGRSKPAVGEVYTGELVKATPFYKYAAAAASLAFVLFSGTATYAYYTPTSSVIVDINPSIELKLNRWNRIIKAIPLNSDGEKVLDSLNIKHKPVNDGLDSIVEEAKKDNFINDDYVKSGRVITISVESDDSDKNLNLSEFKDYANKNNLKVDIIKESIEKKTAPKANDNTKPNVPSNNSDKNQNDKSEKSNNGNDKTVNPSNDSSDKGKESNNSDKKAKNAGSSFNSLIFNFFQGSRLNVDHSPNSSKQSKDKVNSNDNKEKDNTNNKK